MAEATTVNLPERSLFERAARVPSLLNQGVESMVAGTLSLPALAVDGWIDIYRTARQSMGGPAFVSSDLYERQKATMIDAGRTLDGSKGKVIEAETTAEKGIVFGTEVITGLFGPGALKAAKTLSEGVNVAKAATVSAKTETTVAKTTAEAVVAPKVAPAAPAPTAKTRLTSANEDVSDILAKAKAEGEAARAGGTAAKASDTAADAAKATASTTDDAAKAAATTTVAKAQYSTLDVIKVLKREKDLPARLEALSGHGPVAERMVERVIAGARKSGISGDDWRAIQNSRSLPPEIVKKIDDVYNATKESAWVVGPAWERAKGTVSYWNKYPIESAARALATPLSVPFKVAGAGLQRSPVATIVAAGSLGYVGYGAVANYFANAAPLDGNSERDVSFFESFAKVGSQALVDASKFSAAGIWTAATLAAAQLPGVGDAALDGLRGTARTMVQELAEGERDEALAWELAKEKLAKFLPSASVDAMGEFVAGKDLKAMTAEQRIRITDAMDAIANPTGDKARVLMHAAAAEAKQKAQQLAGGAPSILTQGAQAAAAGVGGAVAATGDFLEDADISGMFNTVMQLAKDNPAMSIGMGIGALYGATRGGSKTERTINGMAYGIGFALLFQVMSQLYPGLVPGLMKLAAGAPDVLSKAPELLGINTSSLKGTFDNAAEGNTPAPASAPAVDQNRSGVGLQFTQAGNGSSAPATTPAPTTGENTIMNMLRNAGTEITAPASADRDRVNAPKHYALALN